MIAKIYDQNDIYLMELDKIGDFIWYSHLSDHNKPIDNLLTNLCYYPITYNFRNYDFREMYQFCQEICVDDFAYTTYNVWCFKNESDLVQFQMRFE